MNILITKKRLKSLNSIEELNKLIKDKYLSKESK